MFCNTLSSAANVTLAIRAQFLSKPCGHLPKLLIDAAIFFSRELGDFPAAFGLPRKFNSRAHRLAVRQLALDPVNDARA